MTEGEPDEDQACGHYTPVSCPRPAALLRILGNELFRMAWEPPPQPEYEDPVSSTPRTPSTHLRRMVRTRRRLATQNVREALGMELKRRYEAGVTLRSRGGPNHTRRDGEPESTP